LETLPEGEYYIYVGNPNKNAHGYSANFLITPGGSGANGKASKGAASLLSTNLYLLFATVIAIPLFH
jgi:hypothetical protein